MKNKKFYALSLFLFTFFAVFRCFSAVETGSESGSGSTVVPLVKFKAWQIGRSAQGTDKNDAEDLSFITSTETSCRFSASVGYQGGSQAPNTSPIDPSTVTWTVIDASHSMVLDTKSVKKNWSGKHPSKLDVSTSFNVVGKLTVPAYNKATSCTAGDAQRANRTPVHRGGTKMSFKIKFKAQTKSGQAVEVVLALKADDKDQIRQEYVDCNRPIPTRDNSGELTSWAGENTYDFGHYKTMMDHGLDEYFQDWIDEINKQRQKINDENAKKSENATQLEDLTKSDFTLNSGYRNPHHNHHHAGSTGLSSHMYGYALDVNGRDIDGVSGKDQSKMVQAADDAGARHSQRYPNKSHVHADWAPNSPKKWTERKKTAEDPPSFALPEAGTDQMVSFSPASGSSYTAVSGGTHTGEVRASSLYGAYLYINGEYVKWVWGSKTAKSLLLSYTFGSDAVGSYKMEAYVYPWNGESYGTYTYYSYTVSVSGSVPGVPVLSAVGGNGSVSLSWVAPEDGGSAITHYEYRYGVGASVEESDYGSWTSTGSTDTSHTVSSLTNGSYHLFQVRAVNAIGNGDPSIASGVTPVAPSAPTTPTAAPGVPTGLTSTVSNGTVTLNWSAPSNTGGGIDGYQYRIDTNNDGNWGDWTDVPDSATTVALMLENGRHYGFQVRAKNSIGSSVQTSKLTAMPVDSSVSTPSAPQNLSATAVNREVRLSWDTPSSGTPIIEYEYKYDTDNDGSWGDWKITGSTNTSYTVTGLTNDTDYAFKIRARNTGGIGSESAKVTATPISITVPGKPRSLTALLTSDGGVRLDWSAPLDDGGSTITDYEYIIDTDNDGSWGDWYSTYDSSTDEVLYGFSPSTTYAFKIRGVNTVGSGSASDKAVITLPSITLPSAPLDLSASGGNASVYLSWSEPSDDGYGVLRGSLYYEYRYRSSGGSWGSWSSDQWDRYVTIDGLTNGTLYEFEVRAINDLGSGASANVYETPNNLAVPGVPEYFDVFSLNGSVELSWDPPAYDGGSSITDYEYRYRSSGGSWGSWSSAGISDAEFPSYTVTGLTNGTSYEFQVRARNGVGVSDPTSSLTATPQARKPDQPSGLSATAGSTAGTIVLSWTAPDDGGSAITGYQYKYCKYDNGWHNWTSLSSTGSTSTSYTVSGLESGGVYRFRVVAVNSVGSSRSSKAAQARAQ